MRYIPAEFILSHWRRFTCTVLRSVSAVFKVFFSCFFLTSQANYLMSLKTFLYCSHAACHCHFPHRPLGIPTACIFEPLVYTVAIWIHENTICNCYNHWSILWQPEYTEITFKTFRTTGPYFGSLNTWECYLKVMEPLVYTVAVWISGPAVYNFLNHWCIIWQSEYIGLQFITYGATDLYCCSLNTWDYYL